MFSSFFFIRNKLVNRPVSLTYFLARNFCARICSKLICSKAHAHQYHCTIPNHRHTRTSSTHSSYINKSVENRRREQMLHSQAFFFFLFFLLYLYILHSEWKWKAIFWISKQFTYVVSINTYLSLCCWNFVVYFFCSFLWNGEAFRLFFKTSNHLMLKRNEMTTSNGIKAFGMDEMMKFEGKIKWSVTWISATNTVFGKYPCSSSVAKIAHVDAHCIFILVLIFQYAVWMTLNRWSSTNMRFKEPNRKWITFLT